MSKEGDLEAMTEQEGVACELTKKEDSHRGSKKKVISSASNNSIT